MKCAATTTIVALLLAIGTTTVAAADEQEATEQAISDQQTASEPTIKLVHVLNPGEREYLSPNLIGVQNIAMTFLPLSMNFLNVIDAYREIVNGVRYEIVLNAVDTKAKDADIICRLVVLEKPWLTTQWGDKYRELVNSNCTEASGNDNQLNTEVDAADEERGKALNDKYASNTIFNGGRRNDLSNDEMAQLEAQIMPTGMLSKRRATQATTSSTEEPTTAISADEATEATTTDAAIDGDGDTTTPAELSDSEKRWLDDILSVGAYNFEKSIEARPQQQEQQLPLALTNGE